MRARNITVANALFPAASRRPRDVSPPAPSPPSASAAAARPGKDRRRCRGTGRSPTGGGPRRRRPLAPGRGGRGR
ncbi:hypothetical protein GT044_00745 [Streptomyces sp. SID335]|nr:hypothetical protein [Streptomyces sp. SID335]MYZ16035.1 hypothetical protein [Streptomyces sp. SID337]